ncbi:MAG: hypothetical protein DMD79_07350, partial [Candidatus Rokuibacteriota bacterium]
MTPTVLTSVAPNGAPARGVRRRFRVDRLTLAKYRFCYLGLIPVFAIYWVVRLEPIGRTFVLSFYDWHLVRALKPFVGLDNYRELARDQNFLLALQNTTLFAVFVVTVSVVLGLALAVLLAGKLRFTAAY